MSTDRKITGIACCIFKKEIEKLIEEKLVSIPFIYLDSMLHMKPDKLNDVLEINTENPEFSYILVYGDCCPKINSLMRKANISKAAGINCCEIFLGKKRYRKVRSDEAFIVLPEWAPKFEDIFINRFGFNQNNVKCFFKDMHKEVIYLDTGVYDVDQSLLNRISELTGMDIKIEKADLKILADTIAAAVKGVK